ncbi:DUF2520 domain-containing protein [Antarcticibacterium sp. 1MA-6-2]|uniref:Rossmann-like and DUF2520 domain-containing protein n=1 Tax=Antarcticibacterium sp. 1MA-6-2 TaxID=2908210 RepID=UPI001F2A9B36|nr:DUF2520 domain-containing protein [Antarcticibacterium sp. 1MA-6-2]UJH91519.1 DUF2520 domain-containing protein [Antarcticibacterium sp. 1MA-6-2]
MKSIVLFGAGNVATHLFSALSQAEGYEVIQVYNHQKKSLEEFKDKVPVTTDFTEVFPADIYILALKDEAIPLLAEKILYREAMILHTSGSTPLSILKHFSKKGILYPLQTFSKSKALDFKTVPLCIEAANEQQLEEIKGLARQLSEKVYEISSEQRKALHLAAVFVSNFSNYMYSIGDEICRENDLPFEILHPLVLETATKATNMAPKDAQT